LVVNEARVEQPIMPLRLFASRQRSGAYLTRMLYLAAMIGFFFFTTQYLQGILGFNPLQAGLAFLPMSAVNFAAALLVTRFIRRLGSTPVLVLGVGVTLAGMAWLSRVAADSSYLTAVALPMVLIGIGQGLAFAPMTSAGLADVDAHDAGAASGLINTFHQLGSALGLGILATIGAAAVPAGTSGAAALVGRVSAALTGGTVMLAVALLAVLTFIARRATTRPSQLPAFEPQTTRAAVEVHS
jgi:predicted MFS family arabinose efflux permease